MLFTPSDLLTRSYPIFYSFSYYFMVTFIFVTFGRRLRPRSAGDMAFAHRFGRRLRPWPAGAMAFGHLPICSRSYQWEVHGGGHRFHGSPSVHFFTAQTKSDVLFALVSLTAQTKN